MKLVFISDTHTMHDKLVIPECDILFHCGDWTYKGHKHEVEAFAKWLDEQPAKHIVITPGNHEVTFQNALSGSDHDPSSKTWITDHCPRAHVLIHESIEIEGLKIFGSPWTPAFGFRWAWNAGRTPVESAHIFKPFIGDLWQDIPLDTQILITHGPGLGTLDWVADYSTGRIINVGCHELTKKIYYLKDLQIHAFGHLHMKGGNIMVQDGVKYINASSCDDQYKPVHKPIKIDI